MMITYPSTHGVFESRIREIVDAVHDAGGQVYMDGANMNAQVGLTNPGYIGADVCHLNLHKTLRNASRRRRLGVGPICVAEHLRKFLPSHSIVPTGGDEAHHGRGIGTLGFGHALPDHLRLHQDAGRRSV